MKPFRFPLKAVLTLRTRMEREALEAYARALADLRQTEEALDALQRERVEVMARLREATILGSVAAELMRMRHYQRYLRRQEGFCLEAIQQAKQVARRALEKVLAARQQREAVEHLRARHLDRHRRAQEREDQRLLDERAVMNNTAVLSWQNAGEVFA